MVRPPIGALALVAAVASSGCCLATTPRGVDSGADAGPDAGALETAQWARTPAAALFGSLFSSVAVASSGDVYVVGYSYGQSVYGDGVLDLGNGVTCTESDAGGNVLLVKYDSAGTAQWIETLEGAVGLSEFSSVALDSSNVYVAGCVTAAGGTVSFGSGVTVTQPNGLANAVLVKYDASGAAQWARTVSGPDSSCFNSLAIDSAGNLYAAGGLDNPGVYDFGNGVTATTTAFLDGGDETGLSSNVVLVKYSPAGVAQWAQTASGGMGPSGFGSVAVDGASNVYALGGMVVAQTYDFGNGVAVTPPPESLSILVKYSASGVAQWAQTNAAWLSALAVDAAGNAVVSGTIEGSQALDFGNGVTAAGSTAPGVFTGTVPPQFLVVAMYDSTGSAEWARTVTNAGGSSYFFSVALDAAGDVLAGGTVFGPADYDFGDGVDAEAPGQGNTDGKYSVFAKYSALGVPQWARVSSGQGDVTIGSVAVDSHDNFYMAGGISGPVIFGNGVETTGLAQGYGAWGALLVKYR